MSNIVKTYICICILICFCSIAKSQTFTGAITVGLNAAQVNGDLLAGYNKLGFHAGLRVSTLLNEHLVGAVELLYSQRGSRSQLGSGDPRKLHLDYVEIPLMIGYRDWPSEDYHKMLFEGGLLFGRLINNKVSLVGIQDSVEEFNPNDVSYLMAATFFASKKVGYSIRYTNSLNFLLNDAERPEFGRLRSFFLTFRVVYIL